MMGTCACGTGVSNTHCVDCYPSTLTCKECFLKAHINNPFHWAQVWDQNYFKRTSFSGAGGVLRLSHRGLPCPNQSEGQVPLKMNIVHVNGIHTTHVLFCQCYNAPQQRWQQLIDARLFPATMPQPVTAFTFSLLKLSHLISLSTQCSIHSLLQVLYRITDDPFSDKLSVSPFLLLPEHYLTPKMQKIDDHFWCVL